MLRTEEEESDDLLLDREKVVCYVFFSLLSSLVFDGFFGCTACVSFTGRHKNRVE